MKFLIGEFYETLLIHFGFSFNGKVKGEATPVTGCGGL
jgi:hypothetical protein